MLLLGVAVLGTVMASGRLDTTLTVKSGARLEVRNFAGSVSVSTWDKNAVRVQAEFESRTRIKLEPLSGSLKVASEGQRGTPGTVDFRLIAPSWMALDVEGPFTDVEIEGAKGDIKVETVRGDVTVSGGNGYTELSTVQGDLSLEGAKGRIKLSSVNQDVTATRISGQVTAESVNGDIILDNVQVDALEASSVSGSLWFNGSLKSDGRYELQSHSGDIEVVAADHPDAAVSVSTFSGDFSSDFDVTFNGTRGHRELQFTLGEGGPQLSMESFSGNIRLLKASAVEALRARIRSRSIEKEKTPGTAKTPPPPKAPKAPKKKSNEGE